MTSVVGPLNGAAHGGAALCTLSRSDGMSINLLPSRLPKRPNWRSQGSGARGHDRSEELDIHRCVRSL